MRKTERIELPPEAAPEAEGRTSGCLEIGPAADPSVETASFRTALGAQEHFIAVHVPPGLSFIQSLAELHRRYGEAMKSCGLSAETQVFSRYHVSDVASQQPLLGLSRVFETTREGAFSGYAELLRLMAAREFATAGLTEIRDRLAVSEY